ncbi:hypothetical protein Ciccas_007475 [Cichlidogyrus casuarinus]|uniref:Uncharacterized protein n=1 Tax=Cichlidogyrus casuarinus TaxID=1844966 RepID=A0ABD2Q2Y0_9PLAT
MIASSGNIKSLFSLAAHWNVCTKSNLSECSLCKSNVLQSQLAVHMANCDPYVYRNQSSCNQNTASSGNSSGFGTSILVPVGIAVGAVAIFLLRAIVFKC